MGRRGSRTGLTSGAGRPIAELLGACVVVALAAGACGGDGPAADAQQGAASGMLQKELVPVLVGFHREIEGAPIVASGGVIRTRWPALQAASAHVPRGAIPALLRSPEIAYVEEDLEVEALSVGGQGEETWGNVAIRADAVHRDAPEPTPGTGVTICVIDSGIDPLHPELAGADGGAAEGYDFVDGDSDPTDGVCDSAGCRWGTGHGTHVTGTIVAQAGSSGVGSLDGVIGVAPGASVVQFRVLGLTGTGSTSAVIRAITACKSLPGRRIASLSLGRTTPSLTEQRAMDDAYRAGVLILAAAGNSGSGTVMYPAGYGSVVSVAAVDPAGARASFSQANQDVELAAPGVTILSTVPRGSTLASTLRAAGTGHLSVPLDRCGQGELPGPLVDCGLGESTTSCGLEGAVPGFVAFVERGGVSFATKVSNATAQGAIAAVIANNDAARPDDPGKFTLGEGGWPPAVSVSYADGTGLRGLIASQGLEAPPWTELRVGPGDYGLRNGTSMATAHATGCAALVWSSPRWAAAGNAAVRERLGLTARDLGAAGRDASFGRGLVDCYQAVFGL